MDLYKACGDLVNQVPAGQVTTYGSVAKALGDHIARRAVGVVMNTYGPPLKMPCHRVVYAGGGLGGFAYGLPKKMEMLAAEGVYEDNGKIADFENILFTNFKTDYPLKKARKEQLALAKKISLKDSKNLPNYVLGLDASYNGIRSYGAGVLFDMKKNEPVKTYHAEMKINFPYVPSYLGFREIPIYKKIISQVDEPAILMIDGNGILHPYGFGIASHLGIEMGIPSIGIAKSKLCGELSAEPQMVGKSQPIMLDKKEIGHALKTSARAKPIYVSPGHKISMASALKITIKTARLKLPEPTRLAHMEATEMRKGDL